MKAWTCCPRARTRQEEARASLCQKHKGVVGKAPKNLLMCTHLYPNPLHTDATVRLLLLCLPRKPGRRLKVCNFSTLAKAGRKSIAHLQDWDGQGWHSTGEPDWNMLAHWHFWAFLCALGSHPWKKHKSHWRIPCGFYMLRTQCRFSKENCPSYRFKQLWRAKSHLWHRSRALKPMGRDKEKYQLH